MSPFLLEDKINIIVMAGWMADCSTINQQGIEIGNPAMYIVEAACLYLLSQGALMDEADDKGDKFGKQLLKEYERGDFTEVQF